MPRTNIYKYRKPYIPMKNNFSLKHRFSRKTRKEIEIPRNSIKNNKICYRIETCSKIVSKDSKRFRKLSPACSGINKTEEFKIDNNREQKNKRKGQFLIRVAATCGAVGGSYCLGYIAGVSLHNFAHETVHALAGFIAGGSVYEIAANIHILPISIKLLFPGNGMDIVPMKIVLGNALESCNGYASVDVGSTIGKIFTYLAPHAPVFVLSKVLFKDIKRDVDSFIKRFKKLLDNLVNNRNRDQKTDASTYRTTIKTSFNLGFKYSFLFCVTLGGVIYYIYDFIKPSLNGDFTFAARTFANSYSMSKTTSWIAMSTILVALNVGFAYLADSILKNWKLITNGFKHLWNWIIRFCADYLA